MDHGWIEQHTDRMNVAYSTLAYAIVTR